MNLKSPIKWVGGKYQLKNIIEEQIIPLTFTKYIEPFAGGLSIFFHLINIEKINKDTIVILNDLNSVLINFYLDIKNNCELLIKKIEKICNSDRDYYYQRKKFNKIIDHSITKSALFLYLNKTCFNGLYRLNKKGEFNASWNKKKYIIPENEITNIRNISKVFNTFNITFKNESYENIINSEKNTLIYLDPPYYPIKKMSFLYSKDDFDFDKFFENMNYINNSYIICSNSLCQTVIDNCKELIINKVDSLRKINSNIKDRKCKELLIMNYIIF